MNQDSGQAQSDETSTTPWETIDADERGTGKCGTGAAPVGIADAPGAAASDPFDPGDELGKQQNPSENNKGDALNPIQVPPVPPPAEWDRQSVEPPVGAPAALDKPRPSMGSASRTFDRPAERILGNSGSTAITQNHVVIPTSTEQSVREAGPTKIAPGDAKIIPPVIDEDLAAEAAVPAVIEAKSFFAQTIVDADIPSDEDDGDDDPAIEPEPVWEDPEMADAPAPELTGASWTIPLLCAGIGLIACCIVIPQADANRRLAYEKMTLQADLQSVQKQVEVNDEFLKKVVDDPSLAERLAQRQLKRVRKGQHVLRLKEEQPQMSPFQITNVAPPPPLPPYKPIGGVLASLCYDARTRLYVMGTAMAMIACGLVMGATPLRK